MLLRRVQPRRFCDDAQNQLAAHARDHDVVRIRRRKPGKTVGQNAAHSIGNAESRRIAHSALERRGVHVGGDGGNYPAALQQCNRQIAVIRADIGDANTRAHEISAFLQPRIQRDSLFLSGIFHGIPPPAAGHAASLSAAPSAVYSVLLYSLPAFFASESQSASFSARSGTQKQGANIKVGVQCAARHAVISRSQTGKIEKAK